MKSLDWTDFTSFTILNMKLIGLWPSGDHYKCDLYGLWSVFYIMTFTCGHTFFQLFNVFFTITDIKTVMATFYITLTDMMDVVKAYLFVKNMRTLKRLLAVPTEDLFYPRNENQMKQIEPLIAFWKMISKFFWTTLYFALFFWAVYPLADGSFKRKQLPFIAWYPYNTNISPYYEITYIYQILGVMANGFTGVTTDTMIAAIHVYIASEFDILYDDLKHLFDKREERVNFSERLINCIKHHRAILKFAQDSAKFANWIILGQFFSSGLAIGITMFHLSTIAVQSSEFFSIASYLFCITTQIFVYCYFGNEVEVKSSKIPYALFESEWTEVPEKVKKEVIVVIERCQRPLKVSALNLFYLSLETFMRILRVAWSYFALLHQVTSK